MRALPLLLAGCAAGFPRAPSPERARQMIAGQSELPVVDVIIVHGCPARPDGSPSTCNMRRARAAVEAWHKGLAPRVLFTGGAVLNRFPESRVMAAYAETLGLPASALLSEEESRHTVTNLSVARGIMRRFGWKTALLVSESMHLVWAKQLAQFYRMRTWLYPADMVPPYTDAYLRAQRFDELEPWKTQTVAYGRPPPSTPQAVVAGRRVACIFVGEPEVVERALAHLPAASGREVQRLDWTPRTTVEELGLWVSAWTRGFNGPVDEVVVIPLGRARPIAAALARTVAPEKVPLRFHFEEVGS